MELLDNVNSRLNDDLKVGLKRGSKVSIAAAVFSIYAYQELKKQLESIDELRFIFTSPTFLKEKNSKASREFYIPRLNRERSIYGTEFEVKLRNEMTQKAIAKECADWIRRKAVFKSNTTNEQMMGFMNVDFTSYAPLNGFTTVDLGCERGNNVYYPIQKSDSSENSQYYLKTFDSIWNDSKRMQDVTDIVIDSISTAYKENAPDYIYFFMLYNIFSEFLDDISEDVLPNEKTGFKESKIWNLLFNFQKDASLAIINKLEKYNGCILADSVGLGKTFTALSVIKYYECRNMRVLVLCPKKLSENWNTYKGNYINNPIADDRLRYDVFYHTDLSRTSGYSNGQDLNLINWGNYDLVVIDESHNFRNGSSGVGVHKGQGDNRYEILMKKIIKSGVKTKVLMLSATPVNNRFYDLRNQLALSYGEDPTELEDKLDTTKPINEIFKAAQKAFNAWSKLDAVERTTENLLKTLDFDFFELLDSVTIARSRKHIEKFYDIKDIGKFPERKKPIALTPKLTDLNDAINYRQIYEVLISLNLTLYTPSHFILPSKAYKYVDPNNPDGKGFSQVGREQGIRRLMSINLLKRLESSVYSFRSTMNKIRERLDSTIKVVKDFKAGNSQISVDEFFENVDFDEDDQNIEFFTVGNKVQINLADMDYISWLRDLEEDKEQLDLLALMVDDITPEHDYKLNALKEIIKNKIENPINENNKKVIIFSAFSDTADYLYENISVYVKETFGLNTAEITGNVDGKTTIPKMKCDLNTVLTVFSPVSKGKHLLMPDNDYNIDILIATDCISEGQNLQDCDYLINYDIHWNPVRIIQRFGRIDRIGSKNEFIQLVNFWPDMALDEYINLKGRVETRMKITVLTSTGDDDLINAEEKGDLEYRLNQLKRLRDEVVDIEDMSNGISILDLGLNEFRMDLVDYIKTHGNIENAPKGLHAVVKSTDDNPPGVIFVLKNLNDGVNINHMNRIHPFYMVYIANNGNVVCDYLNPKNLLDSFRFLCKNKTEPNLTLCKSFNNRTDDGRDMVAVSELLSDAINSIIEVKEDSDIDSLFKSGGTSALLSDVSGLDDFELICFLVVE